MARPMTSAGAGRGGEGACAPKGPLTSMPLPGRRWRAAPHAPEAPASTSGVSSPAMYATCRSRRQRGQRRARRSHSSKHASWKWWPQRKERHLVCGVPSSKQMVHSAPGGTSGAGSARMLLITSSAAGPAVPQMRCRRAARSLTQKRSAAARTMHPQVRKLETNTSSIKDQRAGDDSLQAAGSLDRIKLPLIAHQMISGPATPNQKGSIVSAMQ
mmetsp:Transcript_3190/g.8853  ORF Transcript_3190/g.8853 Transcript_3190/m.8853 type:complete len:214 (-) Transcript_3190:376-1017(-)